MPADYDELFRPAEGSGPPDDETGQTFFDPGTAYPPPVKPNGDGHSAPKDWSRAFPPAEDESPSDSAEPAAGPAKSPLPPMPIGGPAPIPPEPPPAPPELPPAPPEPPPARPEAPPQSPTAEAEPPDEAMPVSGPPPGGKSPLPPMPIGGPPPASPEPPAAPPEPTAPAEPPQPPEAAAQPPQAVEEQAHATAEPPAAPRPSRPPMPIGGPPPAPEPQQGAPHPHQDIEEEPKPAAAETPAAPPKSPRPPMPVNGPAPTRPEPPLPPGPPRRRAQPPTAPPNQPGQPKPISGHPPPPPRPAAFTPPARGATPNRHESAEPPPPRRVRIGGPPQPPGPPEAESEAPRHSRHARRAHRYRPEPETDDLEATAVRPLPTREPMRRNGPAADESSTASFAWLQQSQPTLDRPSGPMPAAPGAPVESAPGRPDGRRARRRAESRTSAASTPSPLVPTRAQPPGPTRAQPPRTAAAAQPATEATEPLPDAGAPAKQPKKPKKPVPQRGWRRWVHAVTRINFGLSPDEKYELDLRTRIGRKPRGSYQIAILGLKGGAGKTTTTVTLGTTLTHVRGDRILVLDADPGAGNLAERSGRSSPSSIADLLADPRLSHYNDVRAHTSVNAANLEILPTAEYTSAQRGLSGEDLRSAVDTVSKFYNLVLADCGAGLFDPVTLGVLDTASAIVILTNVSIDSARQAAIALDWLRKHGYQDLASRACVAINHVAVGETNVSEQQLVRDFEQQLQPGRVVVLPWDRHIAAGTEIHLDQLGPVYRRRVLELAAALSDDFERAGRR
ncbi:MinD/ParA family ATP-binding protein [Mycobacterium marinum]|uniref:MinD/ParA family ATP-binding protein n=5 Tax=Mycobacterium marinum TaxID=1781 RepID=UPI00356955D6